MCIYAHREGDVAPRMVHTGSSHKMGFFFFCTPHVSKDMGISSYLFMDLKDTLLTHNHWVATFKAVEKGTLDDTGGEGVTQFILDDKLGDANPSTGENLIQVPFKRPMFVKTDFDPNSNVEISGGRSLDTKCRLQVEDYFKTELELGYLISRVMSVTRLMRCLAPHYGGTTIG